MGPVDTDLGYPLGKSLSYYDFAGVSMTYFRSKLYSITCMTVEAIFEGVL